MWLYKTELDKEFDKATFKLVAGSSMYAYIVHDFFQSLVITYIVIPTGLDYWTAFAVTFVLCELCCIGSFILLVKLFSKKKKQREEKVDG